MVNLFDLINKRAGVFIIRVYRAIKATVLDSRNG